MKSSHIQGIRTKKMAAYRLALRELSQQASAAEY